MLKARLSSLTERVRGLLQRGRRVFSPFVTSLRAKLEPITRRLPKVGGDDEEPDAGATAEGESTLQRLASDRRVRLGLSATALLGLVLSTVAVAARLLLDLKGDEEDISEERIEAREQALEAREAVEEQKANDADETTESTAQSEYTRLPTEAATDEEADETLDEEADTEPDSEPDHIEAERSDETGPDEDFDREIEGASAGESDETAVDESDDETDTDETDEPVYERTTVDRAEVYPEEPTTTEPEPSASGSSTPRISPAVGLGALVTMTVIIKKLTGRTATTEEPFES
jgi:hypothetical protein